MSTCAHRTFIMSVDKTALVKALKRKRELEGLSLRGLSSLIGVSFSSLARIERGEGEPDNNSALRILDWLGRDADEAGIGLDSFALVHFRASKNVSSRTTQYLLEVASALKSKRYSGSFETRDEDDSTNDIKTPALALSKPEMEEMSSELRGELGIGDTDALDALALRIQGVEVVTLDMVEGLSKTSFYYLSENGADEWSAMSVPLNLAENKWTILRNDKHSLERQRVTYLEECWHILLGHKLTKVAKIGSAYGRTYESSEEHDAYYLASATLLPEKAVRSAVEHGQSSSEIAIRFGTSPELVEYRIKRLGLWRIFKSIGVELS